MAIRYANVRRLDTWLMGPKGDDRDKFKEIADVSLGGDTEAESRSRDEYWDSNEFSMLRYSFLSEPAAFVVYRSQPPMTWQSGVLKFNALVMSSKSRSGRNFIFMVVECPWS